MHEGQLEVTTDQVRRLIADQVPQWAGATITKLHRQRDLPARGPRHRALPLTPDPDPATTRRQLETSAAAMREFREACPVPCPEPLFIGSPGAGYPQPWSVQTWLDGEIASPSGNGADLARDLVHLVRTLRSADTRGRPFPGGGRGGTTSDDDPWVQRCFAESDDLFDTRPARELWAGLRELPPPSELAMCHTDLIPANLLVTDGHLAGVLDTDGYRPADPALDLVVAWHLFEAPERELIRTELGCDEDEWQRGRAWALDQAMGLVWYYPVTNPPMAELGRSTLVRVLEG